MVKGAAQGRQLSVKFRVGLNVILINLFVWVALGIVVFKLVEKESDEWLDDSMQETAGLFLSLVEHELIETQGVGFAGIVHADEAGRIPNLHLQFWSEDHRLYYHSPSAPETPFAPFEVNGFSSYTSGQTQWRTYSAWDPNHRIQIQIAEPLDERSIQRFQFLPNLIAIGVLGSLSLMALTYVYLRRAFAPFDRLKEHVAQHREQRLEPLSSGECPSEIKPLVTELNDLVREVANSVEIEKQFTADAAHELRTPLATLKTSIQVIERKHRKGQPVPEELFGVLHKGVDRCARLIEQLLWMAKVDGLSHAQFSERNADLPDVLRTVLDDLAAAMNKKQIRLMLKVPPSACVGCAPALLDIVLRNLVDNAVRYNRTGGFLSIEWHAQTPQGPELWIVDNGPGLSDEERGRVFDRFYRGRNVQAPGSGLGLAIVKRIVERNGMRISLEPSPQGQGVWVRLGFEAGG